MKKKAQSHFLNFHWETVHEVQVPEQRLSQKGILSQSITYGSFLRFIHVALRAHWCHAPGASSIHFIWCKFCRCTDEKSCQTVGLVVRLQRASTGNMHTYSEAAAPEELPIEINMYRNLRILQNLETQYMCVFWGNLQASSPTAHKRAYVFYKGQLQRDRVIQYHWMSNNARTSDATQEAPRLTVWCAAVLALIQSLSGCPLNFSFELRKFPLP